MRTRKKPDLRKDQITRAAVDAAVEFGFLHVTYQQVAQSVGCSVSLIQHYYPTIVQLRRDLMRRAVRDEVLEVLAQGLAYKDAHALKAPAELRVRASQVLVGGEV